MKKIIILALLSCVLAITACSNNPVSTKSAGFPVGHPQHDL